MLQPARSISVHNAAAQLWMQTAACSVAVLATELYRQAGGRPCVVCGRVHLWSCLHAWCLWRYSKISLHVVIQRLELDQSVSSSYVTRLGCFMMSAKISSANKACRMCLKSLLCNHHVLLLLPLQIEVPPSVTVSCLDIMYVDCCQCSTPGCRFYIAACYMTYQHCPHFLYLAPIGLTV
jgi:hypothetical protein